MFKNDYQGVAMLKIMFKFLIGFSVGLVWFQVGFAAELSQEEKTKLEKIIKTISDIRGDSKNSFVLNVTVKSFKNKQLKKTITLESYVDIDSKTFKTKSLVRFLSPTSHKGRFLLARANSMWYYKKGTRRALRISAAQRILGEASNVDVVGVNLITDYTGVGLSKEKLGNVDVVVVDLVKNDDAKTPYHTIKLWVLEKTSYPVKAEYFSRSQRKVKILYYRKSKQMLGKKRPTDLVLINALDPESITYMTINKMSYKKLGANNFTEAALSNLKF